MDGQLLSHKMWKSFYNSQVGWAHLKQIPPLPCQDYSFASNEPIPYLIVCDGAGSAPLSHIGSERMVKIIAESIELLQSIIKEILDEELPNDTEERKKEQLKQIFINASLKELEKLSLEYKVPKSFFRTTLMIFIIGKNKCFWLKIGDGAILIQKTNNELELIGPIQKGEFINETVFISEKIKDEDVACNLIKNDIKAVISFTDGAGEKLISNDGKNFAGLIKKWFDQIRENKFENEELVNFLSSQEVWSKTTGDDKSIAMLVSELS